MNVPNDEQATIRKSYHPQMTASIAKDIDFGEALALGVSTIRELNDEENPSPWGHNPESALSSKMKVSVAKGTNPKLPKLISDEQKIKLFDYMAEYHVDWDWIAKQVLKNLKTE